MKDKRKAYEEKLDAQLEEWSAQVALLKAKADKAEAERRRSNTTKPSKRCSTSKMRPGLKSRLPFTTRPQSSNEQGRWTHRSDV